MKLTTRGSARALAAIVAVAGLALLVAAPVGAAESAESRGAALLQAVEDGERDCADLSAADFEAIGEFAMGRMLGSPQAHESMDQLATRMMGAGGLERMHQAMGQRFAACGRPDFPGGFGQMMSMMPGMGGSIGYGRDGSMMGGTGYGLGAWMAVAMLVLIVGAGGLAYLLIRRRPPPGGALDVLSRRFAAGEISAEEYAERRRLLRGGSR